MTLLKLLISPKVCPNRHQQVLKIWHYSIQIYTESGRDTRERERNDKREIDKGRYIAALYTEIIEMYYLSHFLM